jgi:gliding motility-associated-like protein
MNRFFYSLCLKVVLISASLFASLDVYSQCSEVASSVASSKNPDKFCATVTVNFTYNVTFLSPLPPGVYNIVFLWGDGSGNTNVPIAAGGTTYSTLQSHAYPPNSDCEYLTQILVFKDGFACTTSQQNQFVQSYRTEAFNQGLVQLINPARGDNIFEFCEGVDISAVFNDLTNFNCNATYLPANYPIIGGPPVINTANRITRWQRLVYNTKNTAGSRIPNVSVAGVPVTGALGADIIANYQDPRGTNRMTTPVNIGDPRRMNTLTMTAPGGFTAGFPKIGDIFEVKIRYWNICNPYANDLSNTPVGGDLINGDNPPIEAIAIIRIIGAPIAPAVNNPTVCETTGTGSYNITATSAAAAPLTFTWYKNINGLGQPINVLQGPNADNTFNPVTEGPAIDRINPAVTGSQTFTRYVTVTQGNACTSPPATITIQIDDTNTPGTIAHPLGATPITICSGTDPAAFTSLTNAVGGGPGATVTYQWESANNAGFAGFTIVGTNSAVFDPPVISARTFFRRRARSGTCADVFSNVIEFRVDTPVLGGAIDTDQTICVSPGDPALLTNVTSPTGGSNAGTYAFQWELSTTASTGPYSNISLANALTYDPPSGLTTTTFYRRRVTSGVCTLDGPDAGTDPDNIAYSDVVTVTVDQLVNAGSIGNPQTICNGQNPGVITSVAAPSGGDGVTYTILWQESSTGGGIGFAAATGINNALTYDPPLLTSTTFYRRRISSGLCANTFSNEIQITVNPLPTVASATGGGSVCSGNPAPDIVFNLTGTPPFTLSYTDGTSTFTGIVEPTNTFTIVGPTVGGTYNITSLTYGSSPTCTGTALAPSRAVTIGGTAPAFDTAPSLTPTNTCVNGASTADPLLNFSLNPASTAAGNYTLTYKVDGGSNLTKTFTVSLVNGDPSSITFSEVALNNTAPSPHIITVVSILTPAGCLSTFNIPLNFTVNPLPANPTGAVNGIACSSSPTGATLSVNDPGAGFTIEWYTTAAATTLATGVTSGSNNRSFTPTSNATATYFALTRNTTTLCRSASTLGATNTLDTAPSAAVGGADKSICVTSVAMTATAANNGGSGVWTKVSGPGVQVITTPSSPTTTLTGFLQNPPGGSPTVYVFRWTVSSALFPATGSCPQTISDVTITVNTLPSITAPAPASLQLCETAAGTNQTTGVNLTSFDAFVTNHPLGAPTVSWFTDAARTVPAVPANSFTVIGPTRQLFFSAASTTTPSCTNTGSITFTVNSLPSVASQTKKFCEDFIGSGVASAIDLPLEFNSLVTGGAANRLVTWFFDSGLTTPLGGISSFTLFGSQTVYAQVTNTLTGCSNSTAAVVNLSVKPKPILNPIQGNASVCTGNSIILYQLDPTFNPTSTYTWSIAGAPAAAVQVFGGGGTNTSNFFTLLKFPAATGTVQIDVFETLDGCVGTTSSLLVTVNTAPAPNTITGLTQVCSNQTGVNYAVTSPNFTSAYTWTVTGATVAGAANDNINVDFSTISPVTIKVAETSSTGCVGVDATTVVTVNPRPTITSVNTATVCSGSAPTLNFTATLPSTFDWVVTGITGAIGGSLVGDTGTGNLNQVLVNNSGVVGSVTYAVTPTVIAAPNCDGASQSVTVTVNPAPVLVNPQTKTICSGSQVNYEIVTNPLNLPSGTTFTWLAPTMSLGPAQGTGGTVSAGLPGTLHITDVLTNTTNASITATYTITPTSGLGCPGTPRTVVVTIQPQPIVATNLNATRCSGDNIGLTLATASGSVAASNYNITSRSIAGVLTSGGSNAIVPAVGVPTNYLANDNYKNLSSGSLNVTYTVVAVSAAGCIGSPQVITLAIDPEPALSNLLDLPACSSIASGLILNTAPTSIAAASYNIVGITVSPGLVPAGTNGVVPNTGVPANYLAGDIFKNPTNASLTVIYQVVPVGAGGCGGDPPKSITLTVLPEPVVSSTLSNTVCSRSVIGLNLNTVATSVAAGNYNIISRTVDVGLVAGGTNAAVPATGVPSGYLISDSFTNTSGSPLNVTYRVAGRSAGGCLGAFEDIVITVNPEPVVSNSLNTASCSDDIIGLVLNTNGASVSALSYNITARSISGGLVANVANAAVPVTGVVDNYLANDIFTNTGSSNLTVTYTVVPVSSAGCLGASKVITVTINPEPVMATNLDGGVCSDVPIGLTLNTNGSSVSAFEYNVTGFTVAPGLIANVGNVTVPASGVTAAYLASDIYTNTGTTALNVTYTVVPVSAATCIGNPRVITLIVSPKPVMSNSLDGSVCSSIATGLTLNTNGTSVSAANYNITARTIAGGLVAAGSNVAVPATGVAANYLASDKFANTTSSILTVTYNVVPISATGCPGPAKLITISINPEPVLSSSLSGNVCSDFATGLTLTTNGVSTPASSYNITARSIAGGLSPGGTNVTVPATAVGAAYLNNDVFTNTGTIPLNVTYTVVPISGAGCIGSPVVITKTIDPEPVVSSTLNASVCSDIPIGLTLNTNGLSVAAANYNITARTISGGLTADVANAVIPATGVTTTFLATDKFTNSGISPLTVTYTVVPVSSLGCLGNPQVITITINPEPVVSLLLDSNNCSDASIGLTLNTNGLSVLAANYNITARSLLPGLVAAGTNVTVPATAVSATYLQNDKFTNVTGAALTVTYTVVPVASGGCLGDPQDIVITINPEPVLSAALNKTVCSDVATGLVLNTNGASVAALNYNITSRTVAGGLTAAGTNVSIPATGVNGNFVANDVFTNTGSSSLTVVYRVVPISASGCLGDPVNVTVTIDPEPVVSTTLDVAVCSGVVSGLSLNTNGTSVAAANYNITARTIAVGLTPAGSNVAVPATGVALSYLNADKFTNIGSTPLAVTYTIVPVSSASCLGKARLVTVTVNPEPVVSPTLNATICSDVITGLTLATNGTSVAATTYNITARSIAPGLIAAGGNAAVPANSVLANYLTNDKFTNNGAVGLNVTYTVVPFSGSTCAGPPLVITQTINPEPVISNGLDKAVCSDVAGALTMTTLGTSVTAGSYNFTSRTMTVGLVAAGSNVVVPSNGVAANYVAGDVFTNTTNSPLTVTYTIVPVSGAGCVGDSKTVIVTINPEPVVSTTLDGAVCSDLSTGLALNTNGVSVPAQNYNITARTITPGLTANGGNAAVPASSVAPNYLASDKFTNPGILPLTVTYTVVPVSSTGCLGDPKIITLTIGPKPVGANDVATICSDATVSYNLQNNVNTLGNSFASNFSWLAASNGSVTGESTSAQPGSIITDALNNVTNANQIVVYTVTPTGSNGCVGSTFTISVTVRPEPVGKDDSSSANSDVIVNYNLQNNVNTLGNNLPANFSWVAASNGNVGGESTTPQSNPLINDILNNVTNANQIIVYTVTPTGTNGCLGNPFTITITVLPEPVGVNDAVTINSSNSTTSIPVNYNLQNNVNSVGNGVPSTFSWVAAPNPLVTGQSTTPQSSGTITDALQNSTGVDQVVVYTVTPTGTNGVVGNPFTITVTIRSRPVGANDAKAVCSDIVVGYSLQNNLNTLGNGQTATFSWFAAANPTVTGESTTPQSTATINDALNNVTNADQFVIYTVTPTGSNGVVGNTFQITVTVQPEPVVATTLDGTKCSGVAYGTLLNTNGVSIGAASYDVTVVSKDVGITGGRPLGLIGAGSSPANIISTDSYTNTTATPLKVTYSVLPRGTNGCIGDLKTIVFTINPEPVMSPSLDNTVCSDNVSNIILGTNGTSTVAASYELVSLVVPPAVTANAGNIAVGTIGSLNMIRNDLFTNITASSAVVVYGIRGISNSSCSGQVQLINLTINPKPVLDPLLNPTPVCSGLISNITLGVAAGSTGATSYNINSITFAPLTRGPSNSITGTNQPATAILNDTYINIDPTGSPLPVVYKIAPVSAAGCIGAEGTVTLTINPAPALSSGLGGIVCSNGASGITFSTTGAVTAVNYNITSVTIDPSLTQTAGNTGPRLGITATEIVNDRFQNLTNGVLNVTYRVEPVSAAGCKGPQVDILLRVEPSVTILPISNATICSYTTSNPVTTNISLNSSTLPSAGSITFNVNATSPGNVISVLRDRNNLPATSALPPVVLPIQDQLVNNTNAAVTVTYTITPVASGSAGGAGCLGTPTIVTVLVQPKPKLVISPSTQEVCSGVATTMTLSTPTTPTAAIQFTKIGFSATGGAGMTSANAATNINYSNGQAIGDIWQNTTNAIQTVTYTFSTQGAGCFGDDVTVLLKVKPTPTVAASVTNVNICSLGLVDVDLTPDPGPDLSTSTIFNYVASAPSQISGARSGVGDKIFQTLRYVSPTPTVANSDSPVTVTYTITPTANGCSGSPIIVQAVVDPTPKLLPVSNKINVCHGATLNIPLASNVVGAIYRWTLDSPPPVGVTGAIEQPVAAPAGSISQVLTNTTGSLVTLTYTITVFGPGATQCEGDQKIVIVNIAPEISASFTNLPLFMCKNRGSDILIVEINGQAPFSFVYNKNDGVTNTNIPVTNAGNFKVIQIGNLPATTTYTLVSVQDAFGCPVPITAAPTVVKVGDVDATFVLITPPLACDPSMAIFNFNQVAEATLGEGPFYTWQWRDGTADIADQTFATTVTGQTILHTFNNFSPTTIKAFNANLFVQLNPSIYPFNGCSKTTTQTVSVYPFITAAFDPDVTEICSGGTVTTINQSQGVTSHRWFWRKVGSLDENDVQTANKATFLNIVNNGPLNPQPIEIVYDANNGNCPGQRVVSPPILIYQGMTADFIPGSPPNWNVGGSDVTFTNSSQPINSPQFKYEWLFGLTGDATPAIQNIYNPLSVNYASPGTKEIILNVTNLAAEAAGLSCTALRRKTIFIDIDPLTASFDVDPAEACFPATIKLKNVKATGPDGIGLKFKWVLTNNGRTELTTNVGNPGEFTVNNPGKYSITLEVTSPSTSTTATAGPKDVTIFDKPTALFDTRPNLPNFVFVPDTEMETFNNSRLATSYVWDFDDGGTSDLENPKHFYQIEGKYNITLIAKNDHGNGVVCSDTVVNQVIAKQGGQAKIPNAFTPNTSGPSGGRAGNGTFNDVFLPLVKGIPNDSDAFNLQIYDRWGNLIFESTNSQIGWDGYNKDGRLMPAGVYVYKLTLRFSDSQRTTQVGDVTMIH